MDTYLENIYLKNSEELQSREPGLLKKHVQTGSTDLKSLSVMEESLRILWRRKPVFLVDEVDKPCVAAMESELSEKQWGGEQLKLQAALVTGICKFVTSALAPIDNTLPVYFLNDDRFSRYYRLTAQEVHTLVEKLCGSQDAEKTNKIISDINAKYNGYYQRFLSGENKKYARYCLFSILNYMKNINTVEFCFWLDGSFLTGKLVPLLRKSVKIMSAIQILFYDDSGTIEIEYEKAVNVQHILGLYREEIDPDPNAVFIFLQRGYLARNLEKPIENIAGSMKINVRIPNLEIKEIYKKMFKLYYESLDENIQSKLTYCGQIFKSLPTQDSTEFQNNLDQLVGHNPTGSAES